MDRAPDADVIPQKNWTPHIVLGAITLITVPVVMDFFNLPGAPTDHLDWKAGLEGFTPNAPTAEDNITFSDGGIDYDDMSPDQKIKYHQDQIKAMSDSLTDPRNASRAKEIMDAIQAELDAIKNIQSGGPGYPPHPDDVH